MNYKIIGLAILIGCSHGRVSRTLEVMEGDEVFTFTGPAKEPKDLEKADNAIIQQCMDYNGGMPMTVKKTTIKGGVIEPKETTKEDQTIHFKCVQ